MGDERPDHAENSRITSEWPDRELRQLPVVAGRQIGANLADLPLDKMVVIDQPIRRWRDDAPLVDHRGHRPIGVEQGRLIVGEPTGQRPAFVRHWRDGLGRRQTSRMLFEPLDAEQLLANGRLAVPGRLRARKQAVQKHCQGGLKSEMGVRSKSSCV